jgi:hypothetical protein
MEIQNKKMLLIGGGIAALGLITFLVIKKKNSGTTSVGGVTSGGCPTGLVPCSNNRSKCYDPMANYVMDPCKAVGGAASSAIDPLYQIVDGFIKLFKKKPATPTQTV